MNVHPTADITTLLAAWDAQHTGAGEALYQAAYAELRQLAASYLRRERSNHTLDPTALIHEAYLRFQAGDRRSWRDRRHFFATAAQAMRRVLVDHARRSGYQKRGGGQRPLPLDEARGIQTGRPGDILALEDALRDLEAIDPFKAKVVELRYFGGFTLRETAEILDCSKSTVERGWRIAQGWLYQALTTPDLANLQAP